MKTRHVGSHLPQRGTKRRLSDIYAGADVFDEATASDGNKTLPRKLSNRPTGFSGVISDRPATDDAMDKRRQGEDIVSRRRERDGSNPATTTQRRGNTGNYYTSDKLGDRRHHRPLSTTGQDDTTLRNGLDDRPRNSTGDTTPQRQARTSPNRRQRKLIDTLAAQSAGRSSSVERSRLTTATTRDSENMIESEISLDGTLPAHIKDGPTFTQVAPVKVQSVRHTYGQQRTILADGDHRDPADLARKPDWETEKDEHDFLMSMPIHETVALESDIEDDLAASEGAIRSVHELRQAGANTLVADGMNDLVDRIGKASVKPSTLRRNALLELAHKMNDKSFSRQFRDQDFDSELFRDLDTEKDTIAAYTLVAILVMQLSVSPGAHITHQLGQNGLGNLFRKMLDTGVDITTIARDRQSNTTKFTQGSLERLKSYILKLSIWMDRPPARLSPRTLALKCLQLLGPRAQERRLFPPVVVDQLFQVLSESLTSDPWGQDVDDTIDFSIALFIIESISIVAMETGSAAKWTADYIPIVADVFSASLRRPGVTPDELDLLILRLVLNTTNNNSAGVDVFVLGGILADLLQSVCRHFLIVLRSVADQDLTKERLDGLLLMLGVVINFVEHSMDVRRAFDEHHGHEASSLDTLIGIFLDNHMATSEVCETWLTCHYTRC